MSTLIDTTRLPAPSTLSAPSKPRVANRRQFWLAATVSPLLLGPGWLVYSKAIPTPLSSLSGLVLVLLISTATVSDLSRRKIFNWTTYTAFVWAIAINLLPVSIASQVGSIGIWNSLIGAATCFALMLVPYSLARGGAGDVKLATAIGALIGVEGGLLVIAFAYIIAAIGIVSWSIWQHGPLTLGTALLRRAIVYCLPRYAPVLTRPFPEERPDENRLLDQPIPLAGFFAVATLLIVFDVPAFLRSL